MSENNGAFPPIDQRFLDPGTVENETAVLPGYLGIPFRGPVPNIKEDDPEYKQPQVGSTVHVRVFDLSKKDDLEYYEKVWQMVANGYAMMSAEEREYDESSKSWRIFMRWAVPYAYVPKGV